MNKEESIKELVDTTANIQDLTKLYLDVLSKSRKISDGYSVKYDDLAPEKKKEMDELLTNLKYKLTGEVDSLSVKAKDKIRREEKKQRLDQVIKDIQKHKQLRYDEKDSRKESNDK